MKRWIIAVGAFWLSPTAHGAWGDGKPWTDNRAEVAFYESERRVDGRPRAFKEQLITMREDLHPDTFVKTEGKKEKPIRALKLTQAQRYDDVNYPVSSLVTVHQSVEAKPRILKVTAAQQDWNGNTFKMLTAKDTDKAVLASHSYRAEDGDQTITLPLSPGDVMEDGLPLALRTMPLREGFTTDIRVWESLDSSRGLEPRVSSAVVTVEGEDVIRSRAGSFPSWRVTVTRPGPTVDTYWFEKREPGILTRMETADGRKRTLYGRSRWPFWDKRIPRPNVLN